MDTYVIAEIGINHNNSIEIAHLLIDSAVEAECSAVKLQLFNAKTMYPTSSGSINWIDRNGSKYSYDIFESVKKSETPIQWIESLLNHCNSKNIELIASVFDEDSLYTALRYKFPKIKIASSLIQHTPMLQRIAEGGVPILMSIGGACLSDVEKSLDSISHVENYNQKKILTIMHCNLQYPTPLADCNLGVLRTLQFAFPEHTIGYSDHTEDPEKAPFEAVRLGATVIEKHITLDKKMDGPDHFFALEPEQLKCMISAIRLAELERNSKKNLEYDPILYGDTRLRCTKEQQYMRNFIYPVLFTSSTIYAGDRIHPKDVCLLRPAQKKRGLSAEMLPVLHEYNVFASQTLSPETSLNWDCIFPRSEKRKTILLRADAHPAVGTGDLVSFIRLGEWLSKRNWDWYIYTRATEEAYAISRSMGVTNIHFMSPDLPIEQEVGLTASLAKRLGAHAVLIQVTDRPLSSYASMDFEGLKGCVSFEDDYPEGFNFVWSWDVSILDKYKKHSKPGTQCFLGPEYVILPYNFYENGLQSCSNLPHRRLLVVMGGGDPLNLTYDVVKKLIALECPLEVSIVLGGGFQFESELRELLMKAPFKWNIKNNIDNILLEYFACDICISAGGLTASELVFLRKPALLIAALGHQYSRCVYFEKKQWVRFLGTQDDWDISLDDILFFVPNNEYPFIHKLNDVLNYLDHTIQINTIENIL